MKIGWRPMFQGTTWHLAMFARLYDNIPIIQGIIHSRLE